MRGQLSAGLGAPVTAPQALAVFRWTVSVFKSDLQVTSVQPSYRIGFGSMSADAVRSLGAPARLVARGGPTPGRDVAVLKVDGGPYVSLDVASSAPVQGALGQRYAEAMAEFRQQHYRAALPLFQQVAAAGGHDPYVQRYVSDSRAAIAAGRDRTPPAILGALPPALLAGLYALVTAGGLVTGLAVLVRRRRRAFE